MLNGRNRLWCASGYWEEEEESDWAITLVGVDVATIGGE